MTDKTTPVSDIPPIFLPGLKLQSVKGDFDPSAIAEAVKLAGRKNVIICLKHFNPAFRLFPNQDPSLTVTYTGGIKEAEPDLIDVYVGDEEVTEEMIKELEEAEAAGGVEVAAETKELDLVTKVYEKVVSPFDGHYCFLLRVEDDWSREQELKTLETIEVSVAVHDGDGKEDAAVEETERHGSVVGESFVIDLVAEEGKEQATPNIFFLDWDMSDVFMRQVFSPQEVQLFDDEKDIPKDILFLGAADNKQYNPLENLKFHVNLFGYDGSPEDLVIKVFHGVDYVPNLKKSAGDVLEDAIKGAVNQLDLSLSTATTSTVNNEIGWVTFEFNVQNVLLAFLASYVTEFPDLSSMSREDFEHILDPDSHKSDEEENLRSVIMDTITSVRLSVFIEDSTGITLSKFLLDALESNDMYYDSAVQLLKNRDNWMEEKLIKWSTLANFSSLTNFNCLYRFAQFKVSEKESVPLAEEPTAGVQNHAFEVTVNLPNIEVDPSDLSMLVQHKSNDILHFQDEDASSVFKFLSTPTINEGNDSVTFKWMSTNPNEESGTVEVNVSLLVSTVLIQGGEPRRDDFKKIGSSVSFVKKIGQESETHITSLKIRKSISLGLEEVSPLEESVADFLEAVFNLVLKISGLEDSVSRSELENSSDEIGSTFHRKLLKQDNSTLYTKIIESTIFGSNPTEDPDYDEEKINTDTAKLLLEIFEQLITLYSGDLRDIIKIILDEKGLKESNENYHEEFEKFRKKFLEVFQLSPEDLASELATYQSSKIRFISAGRTLYQEIEEVVNNSGSREESFTFMSSSYHSTDGASNVDSAYEVLVASGLKMDKKQFEEVIVKPMQSLDRQSRQVSREIDRMVVSSFDRTSIAQLPAASTSTTTTSSTNLASIAATMEDKLTQMLHSAMDAGDEVTSVLDSAQGAMDEILSPLESLDEFRSTMGNLTYQAQSLERAINIMVSLIITVGSRCPLWPVKAIVNVIKSPLNMLKNALKRGKDTIARLNSKISSNLRSIISKKNKIRDSTDKLDTPRDAIGKFQEIIAMLSTLAASGLLPIHLISEFINTNTLKSFFDTLNSQAVTLRGFFEGFGREISSILPYFPSISSLFQSVRDKFNIMRPVDNLFRTLKPWVDKAVALFQRHFPWWLKWMFQVILKPIEWTIDLLLRPFQSTIRRIVESINPFGGLSFFNTVDRYVNYITSSLNGVDNKIDQILSFTTTRYFEGISDTLANGLAIVLRAMYTLLSQAIVQGADSIEYMEEMLLGSSAASSLMAFLRTEKESDESVTLSSLLLKIKARSIDGPSAGIDTYLKNHVSSSPYYYTDNFSRYKVEQIIHYDSSYEFLPCFLNPLEDAKTPYFERNRHYSWLTGSLAGVLHHQILVDQALNSSLDLDLNSVIRLRNDFLPKVDPDGKCTIRLFTSFNTSWASPTYIDTKLPVKKTSLSLGTDPRTITSDLVEYMGNKLFAPIHEYFVLAKLGSCSWALIEKVVICMGAGSQESIATGVLLLTGLKNGTRYMSSTGSDNWNKFSIVGSPSGFRLSSRHNFRHNGSFDSSDMISYMRGRTLSMDQINELKFPDENSNEQNTELVEQMKRLSMFLVLTTDDMVHPIICHDDTDDKNLLYSPGVLLQPLMDLSGVKEIWEYPIGTTHPSTYSSMTSSTTSAMLTPTSMTTLSRSIPTTDHLNVGAHPTWDASGGVGIASASSRTTSGTSTSSIGSTVGEQVQGLLGRGGTSADGTPSVSRNRDAAYKNLARDILTVTTENTVSVFLKQRRQKGIVKDKVVTLKTSANIKWKYKYGIGGLLNGAHFVTSDPVVLKTGGKKVVNLMKVEDERYKVNNVLVEDLIEDEDDEAIHNEKVLHFLKLFPHDGVITKNKNLQFSKTEPQRWGMTLKQFREYMNFCMNGVQNKNDPAKFVTVTTSSTWNKCKVPNQFDTTKNWVNAHDVNQKFIIKHTNGTGMGVALNMQPNPTKGNTAVVMLSHAWNEDMFQVLSMLENAKKSGLTLQSGKQLGDDTVLWFCCFANFQVNTSTNENRDPKGPKVSEQVNIDAFEKVIESPACKDMIVLQSTTFDPNTRFWCVLELSTALEKQKQTNGAFGLHYLFSKNFLKTYVKKEDNKNIPKVRKWRSERKGEELEWFLEANQREDKFTFKPNGKPFHQGIPNYEMMVKDDKLILTSDHLKKKHTWVLSTLTTEEKNKLNFVVGAIWPKLKYDIFMSKRDNDGWEKKFIAIGGNDKWFEMQKTIVEFQEESALAAMQKNLDSNFVFW